MRAFIKTVIPVLSLSLLLGCEGKFESNVNLKAVNLLLPENNSQCFGTKSPSGLINVTFDWDDAEGANSFMLEYLDTKSGDQKSETVIESSINLELRPGTLYKWQVTVSDDFGNSKTSTEFSFYTEGLAEANHVPFPASLEVLNNGNGTAELKWQSTDLDGDIDFYQIFFSSQDPPANLIPETSQTSITTDITMGTTYYYEVLTYDKNGNSSKNRMVVDF